MKNKKIAKVFSTVLLPVFVLSGSLSAVAAPLSENTVINAKYGNPEFETGKLTSPSAGKAGDIVLKYLEGKNGTSRVKGVSKGAFSVESEKKDKDASTIVRVKQVFNNVPLFGYEQKAVVDKAGVLTSLSGTVIPELDKQAKLKLQVKVKPAEAVTIAQKDLSLKPTFKNKPTANLVVYMNGDEAVYAYQVKLSFLVPEPGNWNYFVDAATGEVINKYNSIDRVTGTDTTNTGIGVLGDTKTINVVKSSSGTYYSQDNTRGSGIITYNMSNSTSTGSIGSDADGVWNASNQKAIVDAHYYAAKTYDYYKNTFGRNSYDGNGAGIYSYVHYGRNYNNAFWDGYEMVYGDGDGKQFGQFSGGVDVVAHELTHAVSENEANLTYQNESGAINESYSDVFGTLVEFYANVSPDWLMGEDITTPSVPGDALRSLVNPKLYSQPDRYADRYTGTGDNGGVHTNSGISNKAAYLISEGGTHYGVTVTGIGKAKLGAIAYHSLRNYVTSGETFSNLRAHWIASATSLYGAGSAEVTAVTKAFDSVGVK